MTFDAVAFALEMMAPAGASELLEKARRAASELVGRPAHASHSLPGRAWHQADIAQPAEQTASSAQAIRSALFAIHRRLALEPRPLTLARDERHHAMFRALADADTITLQAWPLRSRGGRLMGALVVGSPSDRLPQEQASALDIIAALVGAAIEAACRHAMALRDQERLRVFSETTQETLWDLDFATDEVWWGGHLDRIFDGRALVSRRSNWRSTRVHPDDVSRVQASFDAACAGTQSSWDEEYRLRSADHGTIHVREHVYFLRESDGRPYRAIGTLRDVTRLRELLERETNARRESERANAAKDEFLALLGHELRNPLAPIVSVLNLLERQAGGPNRSLEILRRQTQHLVRLVDDLMDVSRISQGRIDLDRQDVAIDGLVQRATEMMQPLFEQRRHTLDIRVGPGLRTNGDAGRLTQVLSNLLANAAKYTDPGGHVEISAAAEGADIAIRVRDNGVGVSAEFLPLIFDLFSQERQTLDRAQGGLGLGLSIVKNIVKLHGGRVDAQSAGLGHGTQVTIRLPRIEATTDAIVTQDALGNGMVAARDLLVVDDNEDAAQLLAELLAHNGHRVRVAFHPEQALAFFDQRRPDIAFVDIGLPDVDGYELVRRLRRQAPHGTTRFVALTGYGAASDKARASAAGFDAHVAKPVPIDQLEQLIRSFADQE